MNIKRYKIIDFHVHPFATTNTKICLYPEYCNSSVEQMKRFFKIFGVKKICGSVISSNLGEIKDFNVIQELNNEALLLREKYKGFYIPGCHVHPFFVKQSILEIERMVKRGVKLVGEICPYLFGWDNFAEKGLYEILEVIDHYKLIFNFHSTGTFKMLNQMDEMVNKFKNIKFIGAHPFEDECFKHHIKRLAQNENYYVDISGSGIGRMGALRRLLDCGKERILFGSDYPVCNLAMHIGGVTLDTLITDEEKEYVLYKNAQKVLNL